MKCSRVVIASVAAWACGGNGAERPTVTERPLGPDGSASLQPCGASAAEREGPPAAPIEASQIDWAGWRTWTRMTRRPFRSEGHGQRFVEVYVTPQHDDFYRDSSRPMPVGMAIAKVIYKEERARPTRPDYLAVMAKMADPYDPAHGNWYYAVLAADGTRAARQGRIDECRRCHARAAADHVYGVPE